MAEQEKQKCRCNKCSCSSSAQALFCSVMGRWLCPTCVCQDAHAALHFLMKEENPGLVYPTDFQETVIRIAGANPCVDAERHATVFEALLISLKDKKLAEILSKNKADKE